MIKGVEISTNGDDAASAITEFKRGHGNVNIVPNGNNANANQSTTSSNAGLQFGRWSIGSIFTRHRKATTTQVSQIKSVQCALDTSLWGDVELDRHADTTCVSKNFRVISHTYKVCEVFPYHHRYESIQEVLIVQAATAYDDPDSGETFILIVNQCLHLGDTMERTLMNPNQLRVIMNDVPVHLAPDPPKATHSIYVTKDDLAIPLTLKGIVSTFPTR